MYYRGAAAAILVYDITQASSFRTLQSWVEELQAKGPKEIALAIAGNKADLEAQRVSFSILWSKCIFFHRIQFYLSF
jgi:GTPase SAR1 family protein